MSTLASDVIKLFLIVSIFISIASSLVLSLLLIALISLCAALATDNSFAVAVSTAFSNFAVPPKDSSNFFCAEAISASLRSLA